MEIIIGQNKEPVSNSTKELKRQFEILKPHFPNATEVARAIRVAESLSVDRDGIASSTTTEARNQVDRFIHSFVVKCEGRVFWTGVNYRDPNNEGIFLDDKGNIVKIVEDSESNQELFEENSYYPNFSFTDQKDMENYINNINMARRYIDIFAPISGVD
jgi:hypothetical protein